MEKPRQYHKAIKNKIEELKERGKPFTFISKFEDEKMVFGTDLNDDNLPEIEKPKCGNGNINKKEVFNKFYKTSLQMPCLPQGV